MAYKCCKYPPSETLWLETNGRKCIVDYLYVCDDNIHIPKTEIEHCLLLKVQHAIEPLTKVSKFISFEDKHLHRWKYDYNQRMYLLQIVKAFTQSD